MNEQRSRRQFLKSMGAAGLALSAAGVSNAAKTPMNRKDRILSVFNGETSGSYIPAAFFMHFDYSRFGGDKLKAHLAYRDYVDMDLIKVQYEQEFTQEKIPQKVTDWKHVKRLPKGFFDKQLALVKGCVEAARERKVPCIATQYSALMCAGHGCGGDDKVARHLLEDPDEVRKGLEIINEDVKLYIRECVRLGVDGFLACTQGGENNKCYPAQTFTSTIKPLDLDAMSLLERLPANILHICDHLGQYDDLLPFKDYPGQAVNCNLLLKGNPVTSKDIHQIFEGKKVFMGGLNKTGSINKPNMDKAIVKDVTHVITNGPKPMILCAQCTVGNSQMVWDNVRLAIKTAHGYYS